MCSRGRRSKLSGRLRGRSAENYRASLVHATFTSCRPSSRLRRPVFVTHRPPPAGLEPCVCADDSPDDYSLLSNVILSTCLSALHAAFVSWRFCCDAFAPHPAPSFLRDHYVLSTRSTLPALRRSDNLGPSANISPDHPASQSVTAPSEALLTVRAYLASTPLVA